MDASQVALMKTLKIDVNTHTLVFHKCQHLFLVNIVPCLLSASGIPSDE